MRWPGLWVGLLLLLGPVLAAAAPEGFEDLLGADAGVRWGTSPANFLEKHTPRDRVVWVGRLESMRYEVTAGERARVWLVFQWLPLADPGPPALDREPLQIGAASAERFGALLNLQAGEAEMADMQQALQAQPHYAIVGGRYAGSREEQGAEVPYIYADAMRLDDSLRVAPLP